VRPATLLVVVVLALVSGVVMLVGPASHGRKLLWGLTAPY
jgi:hypothetical protein